MSECGNCQSGKLITWIRISIEAIECSVKSEMTRPASEGGYDRKKEKVTRAAGRALAGHNVLKREINPLGQFIASLGYIWIWLRTPSSGV